MSLRSPPLAALLLAALLLAAGHNAPAAAADPCSAARFKGNGFEPDWQFTTMVDAGGNPVAHFLDPENPGWGECPLAVGPASCRPAPTL